MIMEQIEQWMWLIWLAIIIISFIAEAATAALLSIWFAIGGLVALGCSFIPNFPFWAEIIVFFGVSLLVFLLIRPFLKKFMMKRISKSNVDTIIGKKGVMTADASPLDAGEVNVAGMIWTAIPKNNDMLLKGTIVRIASIAGNKFIVEPYNE